MQFFSSTTPLTANQTWNSATAGNVPGHIVLTNGADTIRGTIFADQAGTLFIEQSADGTNWDVSTSYSITASAGQGFVENIVAAYCRLRYTNGASGQGAFRLSGRIHSNDQSNG